MSRSKRSQKLRACDYKPLHPQSLNIERIFQLPLQAPPTLTDFDGSLEFGRSNQAKNTGMILSKSDDA
jgi:hypothetical protein